MNRQLPPNPVLPKPLDSVPNDIAMSPGFRSFLQEKVFHWQLLLVRELKKVLMALTEQVNNAVQGIGVDIASAATITPDHAIHRITGTATITTINAPSGFSGPLFLIPVDAFELDTGGNISAAVTATPGRLVIVVYDPIRQQWVP